MASVAKKRRLVAPQASKAENRSLELDESSPQPPESDESTTHKRRLQRVTDRQELVSLADRLARESLFTRNYKWDVGNQNFPEDIDAHKRFVTRYYPYTRDIDGKARGPLLVDEPRNEYEVRESYEKQKALKKKGLRFVVIEPDRLDPETGKLIEGSKLEDCLQQLGDL